MMLKTAFAEEMYNDNNDFELATRSRKCGAISSLLEILELSNKLWAPTLLDRFVSKGC